VLCSRTVPRLVCLRMPRGPGGKVGKEELSHVVARAKFQLAWDWDITGDIGARGSSSGSKS